MTVFEGHACSSCWITGWCAVLRNYKKGSKCMLSVAVLRYDLSLAVITGTISYRSDQQHQCHARSLGSRVFSLSSVHFNSS